MNVGQLLANTAARTPEQTAIIFRDQRTSYAELDKRANQVANALMALGIQKGDRVGLYIHNLPLYVEAYYGILKAGAIVVPMNVLYKAGEVAYIMRDSGAKALLTFGPVHRSRGDGQSGGARAPVPDYGGARGDPRHALLG